MYGVGRCGYELLLRAETRIGTKHHEILISPYYFIIDTPYHPVSPLIYFVLRINGVLFSYSIWQQCPLLQAHFPSVILNIYYYRALRTLYRVVYAHYLPTNIPIYLDGISLIAVSDLNDIRSTQVQNRTSAPYSIYN